MSYIRVPPGHPEGYLEGFAQIYSDIADIINNSQNSNNLLKIIPDEEVGMHIMNFISACVESSKNNSTNDINPKIEIVSAVAEDNVPASREPKIGPVQENETIDNVKAIKKVPINPPPSAFLFILFKNLVGI